MSPLIANESTLFRTGRWVMHSITLCILGVKPLTLLLSELLQRVQKSGFMVGTLACNNSQAVLSPNWEALTCGKTYV